MTQSPTPNDRLTRVEAALERQVEVNADLRTNLEILSRSVADLRLTAEALVTTSEVHQQNFEVVAQELRQQRSDISQFQELQRQMQESQRTTNTTLERMGAILEYLVNQQGGGN